jgi:hypothetical protein
MTGITMLRERLFISSVRSDPMAVVLKNDLLELRTGCMQLRNDIISEEKRERPPTQLEPNSTVDVVISETERRGEKMQRTEAQNTPHCLARPKNALENTHSLVCADVLCAKHDYTNFGALRDSSTPAPRRTVTRNPTISLSLYLLLMCSAHGRGSSDAKIESENLHRHARAALFRPSRRRRMWK